MFAPFSTIDIRHTAARLLSPWQWGALIILLILMIGSLVLVPLIALQTIIAVISLIYLGDVIFNLVLILRALYRNPEISITGHDVALLNDFDLPSYTILCPLFQEADVVPQFIKAMEALDYPKEKLQILLLLEEEDEATIEAVQTRFLPQYFSVVIVPKGSPQTKPRACNVGLYHATGTYTVIYDAEDIPERNQLRKVVAAFQTLPDRVACVQAKLDFYNANQNIVTRLFTTEYALLFNLTLPGLQSLAGPIPLGGTSNHFVTAKLRAIGGWDPFNVTEDCDLGIRLFTHGYRTSMINSVTYEEANSRVGNWIRQRSRWIKGYMQTLIVHTRSPRLFLASPITVAHLMTFLFFIGGKTISIIVNPILWLMTLGYIVGPQSFQTFVESLYVMPIFYIAFFAWLVGNFLFVLYYLVGMAQRGYPHFIKLFPLIPIYWLMMSLAGWKALWQLVVKPHYWEKTVHGFHLNKRHPFWRLWSVARARSNV